MIWQSAEKDYSYDYAVAIFGRLRYDIDVKPTVRLQTQLEVNNEKNNENKRRYHGNLCTPLRQRQG